jgi:hypothetical protein
LSRSKVAAASLPKHETTLSHVAISGNKYPGWTKSSATDSAAATARSAAATASDDESRLVDRKLMLAVRRVPTDDASSPFQQIVIGERGSGE